MKLSHLFWALLAISLLGFTSIGCKKEQKAEYKREGVTIDLQKVYDLQKGTSPDVQAAVSQLQSFLRYGQYVQALATMDKISNDPSLSADQKKEAQDLIEQIKTMAQKAPAQ